MKNRSTYQAPRLDAIGLNEEDITLTSGGAFDGELDPIEISAP